MEATSITISTASSNSSSASNNLLSPSTRPNIPRVSSPLSRTQNSTPSSTATPIPPLVRGPSLYQSKGVKREWKVHELTPQLEVRRVVRLRIVDRVLYAVEDWDDEEHDEERNGKAVKLGDIDILVWMDVGQILSSSVASKDESDGEDSVTGIKVNNTSMPNPHERIFQLATPRGLILYQSLTLAQKAQIHQALTPAIPDLSPIPSSRDSTPPALPVEFPTPQALLDHYRAIYTNHIATLAELRAQLSTLPPSVPPAPTNLLADLHNLYAQNDTLLHRLHVLEDSSTLTARTVEEMQMRMEEKQRVLNQKGGELEGLMQRVEERGRTGGALRIPKEVTTMVKTRTLNPKPLFDEDLLREAFAEHKVKPSNAAKLWRYLIQQPDKAPSYHDIPDFSKVAKKVLDDEFVLTTSKVVSRTDAKDGSTTKLLIELQDGQRIESVIMRYGEVELSTFPEEELKKKKKVKVTEDGTEEEIIEFASNKRATLCVSSQVGCAMGCTFCATGTMGLLSNLTAGEIVEQLYHASKIESIRNIVFMGMGEPLDNYPAVLSAVRAMVDTARFGLSPSRISISTVGVVPRIHSLIKDAPNVGLALSLHAPTQPLRQQIVPTAKAWHVDRILSACDAFIANQNKNVKSANQRRHILVEYVLIKDVNDSEQTAHDLGQLLQSRDVLLNVIPYNPTAVPHDYKTPDREAARKFVDIVREYGVRTLLRQTMGADAASACGQLVIDNGGPKKNGSCGTGSSTTSNAENGVADLEDLMGSTEAKPKSSTLRKRKSERLQKTVPPVRPAIPKGGALALVQESRRPGRFVEYAVYSLLVVVLVRLAMRVSALLM
ncbi:sorting nexin [Gaertneriomyces sp. JEL0708]|nr:sorting nexin [Gaertneriomyces sp. JEL0708]